MSCMGSFHWRTHGYSAFVGLAGVSKCRQAEIAFCDFAESNEHTCVHS